jgi:hypothetical protein
MNSGEGRLWKTSEWISLGWRGANPKQNVLANIRLATAIAVKTALNAWFPRSPFAKLPAATTRRPPLAFRAGMERGWSTPDLWCLRTSDCFPPISDVRGHP